MSSADATAAYGHALRQVLRSRGVLAKSTIAIGTIFCLLLLSNRVAAAVPVQLYGKSIVASWVENRLQRGAGEVQWHSVSIQVAESIYVSTAGHLFTRITFGSRRGSGSREHVGGTGHSSTGGARVTQFQGHSLVSVAVFNAGARQVQIDFDSGFAACTAHVILGKAAGAGTFTLRGTISGVPIEVQSTQVGGESCAIRNGNVFAN